MYYCNLTAGLSTFQSLSFPQSIPCEVAKIIFLGGMWNNCSSALKRPIIPNCLLSLALTILFILQPDSPSPQPPISNPLKDRSCSKHSSDRVHGTFPPTIYFPYLLCLLLHFYSTKTWAPQEQGFLLRPQRYGEHLEHCLAHRNSLVEWIN